MSDDLGGPVEIFRARWASEAQALVAYLEDQGVPASVDNDMLQGGAGDLPTGWATAPRVTVARADETAARQHLAEFLRQASVRAADVEGSRCLSCGALMGATETCPACRWSYHTGADDEDEAEPEASADTTAAVPKDGAESAPAEATPSAPAPDRGELWVEVAAVMAVGVVPYQIACLPYPEYVSTVPYWVSSCQLTVSHLCVSFVTLYLIRRSGEPWERFGIPRPALVDVAVGLLVLLIDLLVWRLAYWSWTGGVAPPEVLPKPVGFAQEGLMVVKNGCGAFAEELVTRAYLITRLAPLLRSRLAAVVVAAAVFASYHAY